MASFKCHRIAIAPTGHQPFQTPITGTPARLRAPPPNHIMTSPSTPPHQPTGTTATGPPSSLPMTVPTLPPFPFSGARARRQPPGATHGSHPSWKCPVPTARPGRSAGLTPVLRGHRLPSQAATRLQAQCQSSCRPTSHRRRRPTPPSSSTPQFPSLCPPFPGPHPTHHGPPQRRPAAAKSSTPRATLLREPRSNDMHASSSPAAGRSEERPKVKCLDATCADGLSQSGSRYNGQESDPCNRTIAAFRFSLPPCSAICCMHSCLCRPLQPARALHCACCRSVWLVHAASNSSHE